MASFKVAYRKPKETRKAFKLAREEEARLLKMEKIRLRKERRLAAQKAIQDAIDAAAAEAAQRDLVYGGW